MPETEIIDKLYLELSQFTTAKTNRVIFLETALAMSRGTLNRIKDSVALGSDIWEDANSMIDIINGYLKDQKDGE